jgi:hypothetical protein
VQHGLSQLWLEWLREKPHGGVEPHVRRFVAIHPSDAWGHRELAWLLCRLRRFDEGFAEADAASRLDPGHPAVHALRGSLLVGVNRISEAKAAFRDAVRLSVDFDFAITQLIACCGTIEERREELAFVKQELVRQ